MELGVLIFPTDLSVSRCLLGLPSEPADAVLPVLDSYVSLLDRTGRRDH